MNKPTTQPALPASTGSAVACARIVIDGVGSWVDRSCGRPAVAVWMPHPGTRRIPICAMCRAALRRTKSRFPLRIEDLPPNAQVGHGGEETTR